MRNYFVFDGVDSRTLGVYISGSGTYNSPARAYDLQEIPGRDGALVGYERRLGNVELTYPAFICRDFAEKVRSLRALLLSRTGYVRLEDSYHPEEYRMALYQGGLEVTPTPVNDAGSFDLTFHCKPQRYLKSGEERRTYTENGVIVNPAMFDAQPLIRIYGAGRLGIGDCSVIVREEKDAYTDVDCALMEAFFQTASRNSNVVLSGNEFPTLRPGNNGVQLGAGIRKVEIVPRWWTV